ncbi:DNA methyltransferase [Anaerococcus sp. HMSC075B03]|uniref:site-specific DNA-methyltransferase n=1 Tax=Anaerococcus sp. HMSC075B03 TaxID=1739537 RepID=UPI0008A57929|nr:site-specific DNA-methyltransferase [Anaerococcus sp. HMSC075B03]OFO45129.1 DNA methyltransferase [Anaerococcus sp. HMSC075B03]
MDKMRMESVDLTAQNIDKIGALFPNCITETADENGNPKKAINFELLKQMLSGDIIEGDEAYEFTWVGKKASIVEANKSIRKTLRPCPEESVDWDNTENLYLEGKNIEVLKLLQESYLNSIKMIYIDPPYNTGNNIIYPNDYSISIDEYNNETGIFDENGNVLMKNTDTNGRFHSDWCSMMYSVLLISRNLLTNDGYIALAIDDNELFTLKMMCDEVFGEHNFIGTLVTRCNPQGRNKNNLDPVHEYHLLYAKDLFSMPPLKIKKLEDDMDFRYLMRSGTNSRKFERPFRFYPMLVKNGKVSVIDKEEYEEIYSKRREFNEAYISQLKYKYEELGYTFVLPISKNGEEKVWQRTYDRVSAECNSYIYEKGQIKIPSDKTRTPISLWTEDIYSNVSNGTNKLKELFGDKAPFDFSKSVYTVKDLISLNTNENDIVLDFFSGSATTAHATMLLNSEDGNNRKFIMIQIPEPIAVNTDSYKMGYQVICDVGKERIRRAGKKIKEENPITTVSLDTGFRVLKIDDSNMNDVYYRPSEYSQEILSMLESNVKSDRNDLDLLFGCLLEWGLPLSLPYSSEHIDGCTVHNYNEGDLIACFDKNVPDSVIKEIARRQPLRAVFRDSSFENSPSKINVGEIFKLMAPDTRVKVI